MKKISVLGTEYTIHRRRESEDIKLKESNGYCETYSKEIVIGIIEPDERNLKNLDEFEHKVLRHEIIHAFLHESGLDSNSEWATNEELVDWIALQLPKIVECLGVLENEQKAETGSEVTP